jgi:UDPglucose 6-dehydrogenase
MNIAVIGTGYVGLVVGACLAETGNDVICADVDGAKIEGLKQNKLPIYEPGLDAYVERNQRDGRLSFTTDVAWAVGEADVVFIAVGTPQDEDGSADLRHVLDVAGMIGKAMRREVVVVTKSTVPVGTASRVAEVVGKHAQHNFHMVSNPEFLKEGNAIDRSRTQRHGRAVCALCTHGASHHLHGHSVRGDDEVRGERDARDAHLVHE